MLFSSRHLFFAVALAAIMFSSSAGAAVLYTQIDIADVAGNSDTGINISGVDVTIDASAIALIFAPGDTRAIPHESVTLTVSGSTGVLSIGSLLFADVENFNLVVLDALADIGEFSADLVYTGGSMQGSLTGGRIEGAYFGSDVNAKVGAVSSVPVPAAFWLLGSGLIGLAGFARRR